MVKLLTQTPTAEKQNIISPLGSSLCLFQVYNPVTTTSNFAFKVLSLCILIGIILFTTTCFFTQCLWVIHVDAHFVFSLLYCILLYKYPHFIQT